MKMQPRTSPLRQALAGLCGPVARSGPKSLAEQLAAAGLELRLYTPPRDLGDPHLEQVCLHAASLGLVLTDADGNVVGGLQPVTTDVLDGDSAAGIALLR